MTSRAVIALHQALILGNDEPITAVKTRCSELFGKQGRHETCSAAVRCLPNRCGNIHKTHTCDSSVAVPDKLAGVPSAVQPCFGDYELLQWLPATPEQVRLQLKYPAVHQQLTCDAIKWRAAILDLSIVWNRIKSLVSNFSGLSVIVC